MLPLVLLGLLQFVVVEDHAPFRAALLVPVVTRGLVVPPARDAGGLVLRSKTTAADQESRTKKMASNFSRVRVRLVYLQNILRCCANRPILYHCSDQKSSTKKKGIHLPGKAKKWRREIRAGEPNPRVPAASQASRCLLRTQSVSLIHKWQHSSSNMPENKLMEQNQTQHGLHRG